MMSEVLYFNVAMIMFEVFSRCFNRTLSIYYYLMCHLTSINIKLIRTLYFPSQNWINNFMLCQRYISLVCFHFFQHHRLKRDKFDCNTHRYKERKKQFFWKIDCEREIKGFTQTNTDIDMWTNKVGVGGKL